jgi:hypothetical protein
MVSNSTLLGIGLLYPAPPLFSFFIEPGFGIAVRTRKGAEFEIVTIVLEA